ncbi:hypothetical protein R1sor_015159 [Riccia sorocarpa]|uniref:Eukaryotic translation initiation factor 2A n=1 Tax=Riccia sorocarpa TaxID=122646 RepID=A0ABD3HFB2_9MARC
MATSPPLSFFVRGPDGLSLLLGPPFEGEAEKKLEKVTCSAAKFSPDGRKLAVTTAEAVVVYDADTCKEVLRLPMAGAAATFFSPRGSYLQTFQKPTGQEKNLTLWDLKSGSIAFQLFQKAMSKSNWPAIQFSDDETLACRLVTNEVHFYDGRDFQKGIIDKLRLPGIAGVQLSHAPGSHVAAYVPEAKGQPASARIYKVTEVSQGEPVARRSFFKSSTAQLIWNKGSTGLLVLATSDVDKSNQSYYGETRLHFLTSNGKHEGAVPLSKLVDHLYRFCFGYYGVFWSLFEEYCSPAFWDRETLKTLGTTKAPLSVTSEWSPDGRYFMTATTAPRLQVDNGIRFFKCNGSLYHETKYEKLYQAEWRPAPAELYPDRPPSPSSSKAAEKKQETKPAAKPAAYRPPNASNSAAVRAQSSQMEKLSIDAQSQSAGATDVPKKLRALNKKLRQIEELKESKTALTAEQQEKISQESALRAEIKALEAQKS